MLQIFVDFNWTFLTTTVNKVKGDNSNTCGVKQYMNPVKKLNDTEYEIKS